MTTDQKIPGSNPALVVYMQIMPLISMLSSSMYTLSTVTVWLIAIRSSVSVAF